MVANQHYGRKMKMSLDCLVGFREEHLKTLVQIVHTAMYNQMSHSICHGSCVYPVLVDTGLFFVVLVSLSLSLSLISLPGWSSLQASAFGSRTCS